jgi:uncharacterized membrane protein
MDEKREDKAELIRGTRQLRRLEILMDVVYALVIWRLFMIMPRPEKIGEWRSLYSFLSSNAELYVIAGLGLVIVIIYWIQNNALFGYLDRTDGCHTVISIVQLFFLLLFLYSIRLGLDFPGESHSRALESVAVALVGIASIAGWRYAMKNRRLLSPEVTTQRADQISDQNLAEPIAAGITLPCAFLGPIIWELAWLSYIPVSYWLRRRRQTRKSKEQK